MVRCGRQHCRHVGAERSIIPRFLLGEFGRAARRLSAALLWLTLALVASAPTHADAPLTTAPKQGPAAPANAATSPTEPAATGFLTALKPPEFLASAVAPMSNALLGLGAPKGRPLWREVFTGADVTPRSWLLYGGATIAPFGDLWSNGPRLRASAGYGVYRYTGRRLDPATLLSQRYDFTGQISFFDALLGYLVRVGPLTAKAFVGAAMIDHTIVPEDYLASLGGKFGAKAVVELWHDIGERAWASLDMSFTTAHRTYAARARAGYRVLTPLTLGLEAGINGSAGYDKDEILRPLLDPQLLDLRFGGFARFDWCGGEASLSGGLSTDLMARGEPYGTVGFLYQF